MKFFSRSKLHRKKEKELSDSDCEGADAINFFFKNQVVEAEAEA